METYTHTQRQTNTYTDLRIKFHHPYPKLPQKIKILVHDLHVADLVEISLKSAKDLHALF